MCSASKPKVTHSAPPPMIVPETTSPDVAAARSRQRVRASAAYGRQSTILGGAIGGPTSQAKTLLGS